MNPIGDNERFGLIKTHIDAHTMGMAAISQALRDAGYKTILASKPVSMAVMAAKKLNNINTIKRWVYDNGITRLGFSYRLDPKEGKDYFCNLYYQLKNACVFLEDGGILRGIFFAGLPDACELVKQELGNDFLVFQGGESPIESLRKLQIQDLKFSKSLAEHEYDRSRLEFAEKLISNEKYKLIITPNHQGYSEYGTSADSYLKRLAYCKANNSLPITRVHAGPYNPNRIEALKEFLSWTKELAQSQLLDVLSIGSSQLTQSNFGEDWKDKPNGGGLPINSEIEYRQIAETAKPMLVRTYAGTKNIESLAQMYERALNISWHALSLWWFSEIDGRGKNTVLENLKEHIATIRYIASTNKPLEPNVPHHFSFRGADDMTYIISAFLAAKVAKKNGIRHLILQNMLNTPKQTWGIQDLAKGMTMLRLVKELEDNNFKVSLQSRAGLDYFAPDMEKAKIQLSAVTALMDDIEPNNLHSPEIVHVVSYSEAVRLATPPIIKESIQIVLFSLQEYRKSRDKDLIENMLHNQEVALRTEGMYDEAKSAILLLEKNISNLYSAEGLHRLFIEGFFPLPYMQNIDGKYITATDCLTTLQNGGIRVVDELGNIISTEKRYKQILGI
jgi:hypothetical protein